MYSMPADVYYVEKFCVILCGSKIEPTDLKINSQIVFLYADFCLVN